MSNPQLYLPFCSVKGYGKKIYKNQIQKIIDCLGESNFSIPAQLPPISIPSNKELEESAKLVYVDPQVSLGVLIQAIRVSGCEGCLRNEINTNEINTTEIYSVNYIRIPENPYCVFMRDGSNYRCTNLDGSLHSFIRRYVRERDATLREVLFLIFYYPEIIQDHDIFLSGSYYYRTITLRSWFEGRQPKSEYGRRRENLLLRMIGRETNSNIEKPYVVIQGIRDSNIFDSRPGLASVLT